MNWWLYPFNCEKCKKEMALMQFVHTADGQIKLLYHCFGCKTNFEMETTDMKLRERAEELDMKKRKKLPAAPITLELSDDDKTFLHTCNICE